MYFSAGSGRQSQAQPSPWLDATSPSKKKQKQKSLHFLLVRRFFVIDTQALHCKMSNIIRYCNTSI